MTDTENDSPLLGFQYNRNRSLRSKITSLAAVVAVVAVVAVIAVIGMSQYAESNHLKRQENKINEMSKSLNDLVSIFSQGSCPDSRKRQQRDENGDGGCVDSSIPSQLTTMAQQISLLQNITKNLGQEISNGDNCEHNHGCGDGGQCRNAPDVCEQLGSIGECCNTTQFFAQQGQNCACAGRDCACRGQNCACAANMTITNSIQTCTPIESIPISLSGGRCYRLKNNFTISSGNGITIRGQSNIHLYFDDFEIQVLNESSSIFIANSSNIHIYNPRIRSSVPRYETNTFGIRVEIGEPTSSFGLFFYYPFIHNMRIAMNLGKSDVYILEPRITSTVVANFTGTMRTLLGIVGSDMTNVYISGGYISLPILNATATFTTGILIQTAVLPSEPNQVYIEKTVIDDAGLGISLSRGRACHLVGVTVVLSRFARVGTNALQIGADRSFESVIVENSVFTCNNNPSGADCVSILNARSVIMKNNIITGAVRPVIDYQGALLHIGAPLPGGTPFIPFIREESIIIDGLTVRATTDNVIGVFIRCGLVNPRNISVTVKNAHIHGGLAGLVLANVTRNTVVESVTISDAPYCFAAINGTDGVTFINNKAFRCCRCYYADNTTSAVGMYNNYATRCNLSYLDEGTENEMSVGPGTEGNNRALGETGGNCTLPVIPLIPTNSTLLASNLDYLQAIDY